MPLVIHSLTFLRHFSFRINDNITQDGNIREETSFQNNMVEPSTNKRHSPDTMAINRSFMLFVQGKLIPNRQKQYHVKAQQKNVSVRPQTTQAGRRKRKQNHKHQRQRTFSPIPILEIKRQRHRTYSEIDREHEYWESVGFPEFMEEADTNELLEVYEWEKMDPKERWEQEQLKEFEEITTIVQLPLTEGDIQQQILTNDIEKDLEENTEEKHQQP